MSVAERLAAALAGRYRIERELGAGGMATVYLAQDLKHDRQVALKVLKPELAAVVGAQRFLAEIRTTANLHHPHILPLHDSGEVQGTVFYVMPMVDGESLRDRLRREKQLPIPDAVRIATEVADALAYAHGHGVIHRDVKPENILLHGEHALVADFGIALAAHATGGERMTETGMSLGTPAYMSPEQAMGERTLDARTDVYALGCVLYEMLVGDPPFQGSTAQAIVAKVLTERPVPPGATRDTVPIGVEQVVLRALAKLPADRFGGAQEFARALAEGVGTAPSGATYAGARGRDVATETSRTNLARRVIAALATLSVGATAIAVWALTNAPEQAALRQYALATGPGAPLPNSYEGALSPDGSTLALVTPSAELWLKRPGEGQATRLEGATGVVGVALSPDGGTLVWSRGAAGGRPTALLTSAVENGSPVVIAENVSVNAPGIALLDDGSAIATREFGGGGGWGLIRVPRGGGEPAVVHRADSGYVATFPAALPGSRKILFIRWTFSVTQPELWGLDLVSGTARRILAATRLVAAIDERTLLLLGEDNVMRVAAFDADRLALVGDATPILANARASFFAASREGTLAVWSDFGANGNVDHELVWVDRQGRATDIDRDWRFKVGGRGMAAGWALSPDGRSVAMGISRGGNLEYDTWVKQLPDGPKTRLPGTDFGSRPRWSPDGQWILHPGVPARALVLHRADGTGRDSVLVPDIGMYAFEAALSPDGRWALVRSMGSLGRDISGFELGADRPAVPLVATPADEASFSFSPDGRWLLYEERDGDRTEIVVRPFPATNSARHQVSPRGGFAPLWSRDGRELFYLSRDREMMVVAFSVVGGEPRFGVPRPLFRLPEQYRAGPEEYYTTYDISLDGQRFLMARAVEQSASAVPTLLLFEHIDREIDRALRGARRPER